MNSIDDSANRKITDVACPKCGSKVPWTEKSVHRPFCSRRCQMLDFGDWAMEKNTIPAEQPLDDWEILDDAGFEDPET